jgi:hypothetical protein
LHFLIKNSYKIIIIDKVISSKIIIMQLLIIKIILIIKNKLILQTQIIINLLTGDKNHNLLEIKSKKV